MFLEVIASEHHAGTVVETPGGDPIVVGRT